LVQLLVIKVYEHIKFQCALVQEQVMGINGVDD
jgi:hypothetical protein